MGKSSDILVGVGWNTVRGFKFRVPGSQFVSNGQGAMKRRLV
jgi:hypothetical protein